MSLHCESCGGRLEYPAEKSERLCDVCCMRRQAEAIALLREHLSSVESEHDRLRERLDQFEAHGVRNVADLLAERAERNLMRLALEIIAGPPDGFEPCCRHVQKIAREALAEVRS